MGTRIKAALIIILILTLTSVAPVAAQGDEEGGLSPCGEESVSGTVVAVDGATGTVTIDTGEGLCTVTVATDFAYDHPIVALLGSYFGDVSAENLNEALEITQGCAVYDSDEDLWTWVSCSTEGADPITVIAGTEDGPCTFTAMIEGEEGAVAVRDPMLCEDLSEALKALFVNWKLDEGGTVIQPGDEIDSYHEDGLGFGVLVKLYAMSAESQEACSNSDEACGVMVEELVELFLSGTGMGELFKDFGRPSTLGVGHVRNSDRRPGHSRPSLLAQRFRSNRTSLLTENGPDSTGKPAHAGPKEKASKQAGKPAHAGPKPKSKVHPGKPAHAGPKPKSKEK